MLLQQDGLQATNLVAITKQSAKYNKLRNGNRRRRVKWATRTATFTVGQAPKTMECSCATSPSLLEPSATRNALHRGEEVELPSTATGMRKSRRCKNPKPKP